MSKLISRFFISHAHQRASIKVGICPGHDEAEYYMKSLGKAAYKKWKRSSNRVVRVAAKRYDLSDVCPN